MIGQPHGYKSAWPCVLFLPYIALGSYYLCVSLTIRFRRFCSERLLPY